MNKKEDEKKYTKISIPNSLAEKIKKRIKGTEFETIDSYVNYVIKEVISSVEEDSKESFNTKDEEKVKNRLRALGYLD